MNPDHKPQKKLVFGCSGSGKSTMLKSLLTAPGYKWRFVFDWDLKIARELGWTAATTVEGLCQLLDSGRPVVFYPRKLFPNLEEGFGFFCRFTMEQAARLTGKKLFGADEMQVYLSTNFYKLPEAFREMLDYGRNEEIDLALAAQSITDIPNRARRQVTEIYVFKHSEIDLRALEEIRRVGIDPEAVKRLPHAATERRVGWIWRHCLLNKSETVIREIQ